MKLTAFAFLIMFIAMPLSFGQIRSSSSGIRNYDPKTETTVTGTVQQVKQIAGRHGWNGTHLALKTVSGTLDVHLGPEAYIASQGFSFAAGDKVEVLGSKVTLGGTEALIAREVKKGDKVLVLRNAAGVPQWAGGHRRIN